MTTLGGREPLLIGPARLCEITRASLYSPTGLTRRESKRSGCISGKGKPSSALQFSLRRLISGSLDTGTLLLLHRRPRNRSEVTTPRKKAPQDFFTSLYTYFHGEHLFLRPTIRRVCRFAAAAAAAIFTYFQPSFLTLSFSTSVSSALSQSRRFISSRPFCSYKCTTSSRLAFAHISRAPLT